MSLSQSSVSISYTINNVLGNNIVTDLTNYAANGEDPANWNIFLKIVLESGSGPVAIYDNLAGPDPDIVPATSTQSINAIPVQLNAKGRPVAGTYTVTAYYKRLSAPDPDTVSFNATFSYELNFTYPDITLQETVNCAASTLLSEDVTNYLAGTIIQRLHTIYPPSGAKWKDGTLAEPKVSTTAINIFGPDMFAGVYNISISTDLSWTISPGFILIDNVKGNINQDVVCDTGLCELLCCLKEVNKRYENERKLNPTSAQQYWLDTVEPANRYYYLAVGAQACSNQPLLTEYRNLSATYAGCNACGCAYTPGEIIIPVSQATNDFVVDTHMPAYINITSATNGNIKTYYVDLTNDLLTAINNALPISIISPDNSLNITSAMVGNTKVFQVVVNAAAALKNAILNLRLTVFNDGSWKVNHAVMQASGTMINVPGITLLMGNLSPGSPGPADVVFIKVSGFFNTLTQFTAGACINRTYFLEPAIDPATLATAIKQCEAEVMHLVHDPAPEAAVYVRLYKPQTAAPFTFADLAALATGGTVTINLSITPQQ